MANKAKQDKKFPITAIDHNVERIPISLLPLSSPGLREFMLIFIKYTLKTNQHLLNFAVIAQGLKHCKENCFIFTEISLPVNRGSLNFGESEEGPFLTITFSKIPFPVCANRDDAQPQ